ncbi:CpaF family protein [Thermoanaerobacterium sp. DL9XJH110]|uniref:CpaF family protein n=1 Tax=Thermoanaerobacterium sp. DL9XJH110 TaxID=3386643 RepID=UPI003BB5087C
MSLLKKLESKKVPEDLNREERKMPQNHLRCDPYADLKVSLHKKVVDELKDLQSPEKQESEFMAKRIEQLIEQYLTSDGDNRIPRVDRLKIAAEIVDEILGYGPITPLLNDPDISEIMVNGPNQVYVEKNGRLELTEVVFRDNDHVMNIIDRIVSPIGRRIDESMPMVDARLPDGSRVNAIIPPLSLNGPVITIRKFSRDPFTVEDLINFGTLTPQMAEFLEACVRARLNIVVSGGTGSGKTTTLNVLSSFIPPTERIITIEDAAELQLRQPHVITLESRPPNIEGKGAVTIRDLVRNALRMRPDRIIVGEVRSGEALDMLQAMNTGHDGSLTTGHANSPRDMLSRLETMVLMAGMDLPVRAIREQISSAIDLIIQQSRLRDGSRRITHITEVLGMEGDVIVLQDLYTFRQTGVDQDGTVKGYFAASGIRPKFMDRIEASGIKLSPGIFKPEAF